MGCAAKLFRFRALRPSTARGQGRSLRESMGRGGAPEQYEIELTGKSESDVGVDTASTVDVPPQPGVNHVWWAAQITLSVTLACVIIFLSDGGERIFEQITPQAAFLAPVSALLCVDKTMGGTFRNSFHACVGAGLSGVFAWIVLMAFDDVDDDDSRRVCVGFSVAVVAYIAGCYTCPPGIPSAVNRSLGLALFLVSTLSYANKPTLDKRFPWFCAVSVITGTYTAIFSTLLPWPKTADKAIHDRMTYASRAASSLFRDLVMAWPEIVAASENTQDEQQKQEFLQTEANRRMSVIKDHQNAEKSIAEIWGLQGAASWEPCRRWHSKRYEASFLGMLEKIENTNKDEGLQAAVGRLLSSIHLPSGHHEFAKALKEPLANLSSQMVQCLEEVCVMVRTVDVDSSRIDVLVSELEETMGVAQRAFADTRKRVYYGTGCCARADLDALSLKLVSDHHSFMFQVELAVDSFIQSARDVQEEASHPWTESFCGDSCRGLREFVGLNLDLKNWKLGLQVMLAISIGSQIALVQKIHEMYDKSFWAAVTVCFIMVDNSHQSNLLKVVQRTIGTILGAVFGATILKTVDDDHIWLTALLALWVFLTSYIHFVPSIAYAGLVAGFTAAIIVVGYSPSLTIDAYCLARIEMTCFGGFIWLFVSMMFRLFVTDLELTRCKVSIRKAFLAIHRELEQLTKECEGGDICDDNSNMGDLAGGIKNGAAALPEVTFEVMANTATQLRGKRFTSFNQAAIPQLLVKLTSIKSELAVFRSAVRKLLKRGDKGDVHADVKNRAGLFGSTVCEATRVLTQVASVSKVLGDLFEDGRTFSDPHAILQQITANTTTVLRRKQAFVEHSEAQMRTLMANHDTVSPQTAEKWVVGMFKLEQLAHLVADAGSLAQAAVNLPLHPSKTA